MWQVVFTKQAQKDAKKLSSAGLRQKAEKLIEILRKNPYQTPPPFEKLLGDLSGAFSRRINIQHRIIYQPIDDEKNCQSHSDVDPLWMKAGALICQRPPTAAPSKSLIHFIKLNPFWNYTLIKYFKYV